MSDAVRPLRHALLAGCGVAHGFGVRGAPAPARVVRPRQVHGRAVARLRADGRAQPGEADAIVSTTPGAAVGVVTADCLPILVAARDGAVVAAIHAGWRGLAAGVIEAAFEEFVRVGATPDDAVAVIGPHAARCCYEVDAPVVGALRSRLGSDLDAALRHSRPGHWWLDLARAARCVLERAGVAPARVAALPDACTICDAEHFHSYRRDGPGAGRLLHFVAARAEGLDTPPGPT